MQSHQATPLVIRKKSNGRQRLCVPLPLASQVTQSVISAGVLQKAATVQDMGK